MGDSQTFLLTVTNIALGAIVAVAVLTLLARVGHELIARRRARRQLLREVDTAVRQMFAEGDMPRDPAGDCACAVEVRARPGV